MNRSGDRSGETLTDRLRRLAGSPVVELAGTVLGLVLVGFVLREALRDTSGLRFSWLPAIGSTLLFAFCWWGLSAAWTTLTVGRLDDDLSFRWLRSQLLRYVPGGIWAPISRFVDMDGGRAERTKLLLAETLGILLMALVIGSALAAFTLHALWGVAAVLALVGLGLLAWRRRTFGVPAQRVGRWYAVLALSLFCYPIASAWAQHAVAPGIPFWHAAAAGLLSWIAGYVVVVAPSGVGAKEWAYLALVTSSVSSAAAAGVIAARVFWIIGELLLVGASLVARRLRPA